MNMGLLEINAVALIGINCHTQFLTLVNQESGSGFHH